MTDSGADTAPESLSWSSVERPERRAAGSVACARRSISMLSSGCRSRASRWKVRGREEERAEKPPPPVVAVPPAAAARMARERRMEETEAAGEWRASVSEA